MSTGDGVKDRYMLYLKLLNTLSSCRGAKLRARLLEPLINMVTTPRCLRELENDAKAVVGNALKECLNTLDTSTFLEVEVIEEDGSQLLVAYKQGGQPFNLESTVAVCTTTRCYILEEKLILKIECVEEKSIDVVPLKVPEKLPPGTTMALGIAGLKAKQLCIVLKLPDVSRPLYKQHETHQDLHFPSPEGGKVECSRADPNVLALTLVLDEHYRIIGDPRCKPLWEAKKIPGEENCVEIRLAVRDLERSYRVCIRLGNP